VEVRITYPKRVRVPLDLSPLGAQGGSISGESPRRESEKRGVTWGGNKALRV